MPFFVWIGWFFLALYDLETKTDLGMIQIILLLCLPILYSVYNTIFSNNKKNLVIQNAIFGIAHVVGYYISGVLYYDHISSDTETILVNNTFSALSIVYILLVTFAFCGIKFLIDKIKKK